MSASKNCDVVLETVGIARLFDVRVDGTMLPVSGLEASRRRMRLSRRPGASASIRLVRSSWRMRSPELPPDMRAISAA